MTIPWLSLAMEQGGSGGGGGDEDRSARSQSSSEANSTFGGNSFGWYSPFIVGGEGNTATADSLPPLGGNSSALPMILIGGLALWLILTRKK